MKLSIIIPVFNEEKTIKDIIEKVVASDTLNYKKEIIVVNDGSTDRTSQILEDLKKKFNFILLSHQRNLGKGSAVRTALKEVSGEFILIQDADLEYEPKDYPVLLRNLNRKTNVVYGKRSIFSGKRGYPHYILGVKFITFLFNFLFSSNITDVYTCYKLFPSSLIKSIPLESTGFELEIEITAKILKRGITIKEVPIHYRARTFKEGKKIRPIDGFIGLWTMLKNRF